MDTNELQRLAAAGAAMRPDWPARSLLSFFTKHFTDRAYGDLAVALAWVATRTKTDTPRLLLEAGPWWKACQVDGTTAPRNYSVPCPQHAGEILPCGKCAHEAADAQTRSTAAALARAQLQSARAHLCPHGIARAKTKCGECERPAPEMTTPDPAARSHPDAQTAQIAEESS